MVDDNLLWKNHINDSISKISKGIGILRRTKSYVPECTLIYVYNALILPHFDYYSPVWDTCIVIWKKFGKNAEQGSRSSQANHMKLGRVKF